MYGAIFLPRDIDADVDWVHSQISGRENSFIFTKVIHIFVVPGDFEEPWNVVDHCNAEKASKSCLGPALCAHRPGL